MTASTNNRTLHLGIDVGSIAVSLTLIDAEGAIQAQAYRKHAGAPAETLRGLLLEHLPESVSSLATTGSDSAALALPGIGVDPVVAGLEGVRRTVPEVRNVISIGGGSFSLIEISEHGRYRRSTLNSACASGTGAFLDQQSLRLQIPPDELPLRAKAWQGAPPTVATRCAVFAKSDMIHLQQEGYTIEAIAAGLCSGLGRSTVDGLLGGRRLEGLTVVTGGVALNSVVVEAIQRTLHDVVVHVPDHPERMNSFGAALIALKHHAAGPSGPVRRDALVDTIDSARLSSKEEAHPPHSLRDRLELVASEYPEFDWFRQWTDDQGNETAIVTPRSGHIGVILGIDIGSTSTKAVLLDDLGQVVGWVYRKTAGAPIRAVQQVFRAIRELQHQGGFTVEIIGVGTTGSGRKMVGALIGADLVMNEISAHAAAALSIDPEVDTIIELGGQDAKFTQLQDGMVYNSVMNHVCAAGTGSFIEEQSIKLGIPIGEFADMAMGARAPRTSDRCTVFMERDLDLLLATGWHKTQVAAAVLHSVRDNYLNKVVGGLHIGDHIYFQGATARNRALVAAFESGLHKPIRVSRFCHLTGALGIALMVKERIPVEQRSRKFAGLAFADTPIRIEQELCELCRNACRLSIIHTQDDTVAWGLKCGRDYATRQRRPVPEPGYRYWRDRERAWRGAGASPAGATTSAPRIALPRALGVFGYYPYWRAFFESLGCAVVMPDRTTAKTLGDGVAISTAECCAPVVVSQGHAHHLLSTPDIDYLFVPHMIGEKTPAGFSNAFFCSYVQAHPAVLKSLQGMPRADRILAPVVDFGASAAFQESQLLEVLKDPLKVSIQQVRKAMEDGHNAQQGFHSTARALGDQAIAELDGRPDTLGIVCVGRPYNTTDPGLNLDLPRKIAKLGYTVLYMDMLPLDLASILPEYQNMYWHYGQRILATAAFLSRSPRWFGVYFSNFMCGPDSYLLTYFKNLMGRAGKPYLCLQVDGHGADAGYLTRIEAALETFHAWSGTTRPTPADGD